MISIIVVQNGASLSALSRSLSAAQSSGFAEITLIGEQTAISDARIANLSGVQRLTSTSSNLSTTLSSTLQRSRASRIAIIDARFAPSDQELQRALGSMSKEKDADIVISPLQGSDSSLHSLTIERLIPIISSNPSWPTLAVCVEKESITHHLPLRGEDLGEMMVNLVLRAVVHNEIVEFSSYELDLSKSNSSELSLRLSPAALSRSLQAVVEGSNIEELFPRYDWANYEQESAAMAYQSLAGTFVKFGDTAAALECLRLADVLEDSPRSLALKGIIAQMRGEMLGAVANMVASLQQYELRKKDNKKHYQSFLPINVERISDNLEAGLAALHRADNTQALQHFSQAVFNFDSFFNDVGLNQTR